MHCVQKVLWYFMDAQLGLTWTCNNNNCANCAGDGSCTDFTLTVNTEQTVSHYLPLSDCRYGDTVKLERISGGSTFDVYEIVTIGNQGMVRYCTSLLKYLGKCKIIKLLSETIRRKALLLQKFTNFFL